MHPLTDIQNSNEELEKRVSADYEKERAASPTTVIAVLTAAEQQRLHAALSSSQGPRKPTKGEYAHALNCLTRDGAMSFHAAQEKLDEHLASGKTLADFVTPGKTPPDVDDLGGNPSAAHVPAMNTTADVKQRGKVTVAMTRDMKFVISLPPVSGEDKAHLLQVLAAAGYSEGEAIVGGPPKKVMRSDATKTRTFKDTGGSTMRLGPAVRLPRIR